MFLSPIDVFIHCFTPQKHCSTIMRFTWVIRNATFIATGGKGSLRLRCGEQFRTASGKGQVAFRTPVTVCVASAQSRNSSRVLKCEPWLQVSANGVWSQRYEGHTNADGAMITLYHICALEVSTRDLCTG